MVINWEELDGEVDASTGAGASTSKLASGTSSGALRDGGRDEGATTIARIPSGGWFWLLPMSDDRLSIGVVERADALLDGGNDLEAAFNRAFKRLVGVSPGTVRRARTSELALAH